MSTDDTIAAWGNHVDGAVALTKLRGTDQFNDPMSLAIFRAVRTMMVRFFPWYSCPIVKKALLIALRLQVASNAPNPSTHSPAPQAG